MFDFSQTIDILTYCVQNDVLNVDEIKIDHLKRARFFIISWTNETSPVDLLVRQELILQR